MNRRAAVHGNKVTFILINVRTRDDAVAYMSANDLNSVNLIQGANRPPAAYGLKYIPHKVVIDGDGEVIKNFDNVNVEDDIARWI